MALSLPFVISGQSKFMDKERTDRIKTVGVTVFFFFPLVMQESLYSFPLIYLLCISIHFTVCSPFFVVNGSVS